MYAKVLISLVANTLLVVVSFPVEEDTNQGSNHGGSEKTLSLASRKIVAGRQPVASVVGLGPPTRG